MANPSYWSPRPTTPEMYNATLVVQEQLKQAGFNAEVEQYDFSTFMEHRSNPDLVRLVHHQ